MAKALIIFVRNPQWGKVKTRLAATIGNDKALEIYTQLLVHTLAATQDLPLEKFVFYSDFIPPDDMWKKAGYKRLLQTAGTLGEKMSDAFNQLFLKGYSGLIIIGSDCLELTTEILTQAFNKMADVDVVIGPANDGGYYLLGMKQLNKTLFAGKQWSTDTVFSSTINDLHELDLQHFALPQLIDIDTEEDWDAVQKKREQAG